MHHENATLSSVKHSPCNVIEILNNAVFTNKGFEYLERFISPAWKQHNKMFI